MAGAPENIDNVEPLKMMPFWAFHGERDPTVSVNRSIQVVASFRALYPSQNHQKLTIFTQDVMNWMLRFKRLD